MNLEIELCSETLISWLTASETRGSSLTSAMKAVLSAVMTIAPMSAVPIADPSCWAVYWMGSACQLMTKVRFRRVAPILYMQVPRIAVWHAVSRLRLISALAP